MFWTGQDYPTGNSSRRETKRQTEEAMGRQHQRVEWNIILRKAENREEWRKLVVKSTVVPQRSARLLDRQEDMIRADGILSSKARELLFYFDASMLSHFRLFNDHRA